LISRCDSAAIVLKTSELLPEPDTPVKTTSFRFGMSRSTSRRLFSRAPRTSIAPQLDFCSAVMPKTYTPQAKSRRGTPSAASVTAVHHKSRD
jgi:hypothetical protein